MRPRTAVLALSWLVLFAAWIIAQWAVQREREARLECRQIVAPVFRVNGTPYLPRRDGECESGATRWTASVCLTPWSP